MRSVVNLQFIDPNGLKPVLSAFNVDGVSVPNNGAVLVELDNQTTVAKDVTIIHPGTVDGNEVADKVVTVPASDRIILGGLSTNYNQIGSQYMWFDAMNTTGLSIGVYYS